MRRFSVSRKHAVSQRPGSLSATGAQANRLAQRDTTPCPHKPRYSWPSIAVALITVCLLSVWAGIPAGAQTTARLRGHVYDAVGGQPVEHALVRVDGVSVEGRTDASGRYELHHIPEGWYQVEVSAAGYDSRTIADVHVTADVPRRLTVRLDAEPIEIAGVTVRAHRPTAPGDATVVIDRAVIDAQHPADVADLLETVPGLSVQRSGTNGAVRVSIRGSQSRHVLVLVNGHPINSSADGEADLGNIPLESVERIEVHQSGSTRFGPGGLGGVINVITGVASRGDLAVSGAMSGGSYGFVEQHLTAENFLAVDSLASRVVISSEEYAGDFGYTYTAAPSPVIHSSDRRVNNALSRMAIIAELDYQPMTRRELTLRFQHLDSQRGLPGPASRPNPDARATDDRWLINAAWTERFSERVRLQSRLGYSRYTQRYTDPGDSASFRRAFDSEYLNTILTAQSDIELYPWPGQTGRFGVQLQTEGLDQLDYLADFPLTIDSRRSQVGVYGSLSQGWDLPAWFGFDHITAEASLRHDIIRTANDAETLADTATTHRLAHWSPHVGLTVSVGETSRLQLRANYGKAISLPTLNSLFWQRQARSSGNPDLKPERSEYSNVGVDGRTQVAGISLSASLTYFHVLYYDLVQWQPDFQGVWKPLNLAGARVTGHEDQLTVGFWRDQLTVSYQNTVTDAINREPGQNAYGNQLVYTPGYQTSFTARLNHKWLRAAYAIRWVDQRYATANNQWWYEDYRIDDLQVGATIPWRLVTIEIDYRAENIRNTQYTLIAHYPMPPREWQLGMTISHDF
ncbi:TonB-dependent receptor [candidate division GN15 bacterium]|nr:TonB-dependent receptor [candidate division GN15 bacterium]